MNHVYPGLNLDLKSGHPALEFTNTVNNHASQNPGETLFKYEDVLAWAKRVGLVRAEQVESLKRKAAAQSAEAAQLFAKSLELREALYRMFVAQTKGKPPSRADLVILNSVFRSFASGAQVIHSAGQFEWQWKFNEAGLESLVCVIALSAADLMTSEYYARLKQCADQEGCGWLFVDTSKNHSRRWCDINDCGNRAKQRSYQKRAQTQKS
jgi:predicted RNA-binding Zn ribbon-like protein